MNKEKKHLIELLNRIDNTKKELKQLNKEYKAAFADVCKSWVEQTKSLFPNLQPCDIGEFVGVDIVYDGKVYNLFISEDKQKYYCMFCFDRKNKGNYELYFKEVGSELKYIVSRIFDSQSYFTTQGYFKNFKKENYDEAFDFFLKAVNTFTTVGENI